jgi:hypothetical protein
MNRKPIKVRLHQHKTKGFLAAMSSLRSDTVTPVVHAFVTLVFFLSKRTLKVEQDILGQSPKNIRILGTSIRGRFEKVRKFYIKIHA